MSWSFNPFTGNLDKTASTPGGSDTQIQFNDGGVFGGDSGLTFDKTTGKLTIGGKTVTADAPMLNLSQTWNNAGVTFTALKFNITDTASSASSILLDFQVGGTSKFAVDKNGGLKVAATGALSSMVLNSGSVNGGVFLSSTIPVCWASGSVGAVGADLYLVRDAAGAIAVRNSTNAQESRVYATYTSASNYQRCGIKTGKTTLSNVSGATVTATGLIPAGALLIGVTSRVNTTCTTATGYTVGTAGDPDLWGVASAVSAGTATGSANFTAAGASGLFTAATDVIVTATGGSFDGTGVIELAVHYLLTEAD